MCEVDRCAAADEKAEALDVVVSSRREEGEEEVEGKMQPLGGRIAP